MSSKRWTIVCLTLIQLIFGCSDAELTKVDAPIVPVVVEMATVFTHKTAADVLTRSDVETLDTPVQFQLSQLNADGDRQMPSTNNRQLPRLPGFGGTMDAKEVLGPGRVGSHPGLPPELSGFELPGFEGLPGTELLRLPQPPAVPISNSADEV